MACCPLLSASIEQCLVLSLRDYYARSGPLIMPLQPAYVAVDDRVWWKRDNMLSLLKTCAPSVLSHAVDEMVVLSVPAVPPAVKRSRSVAAGTTCDPWKQLKEAVALYLHTPIALQLCASRHVRNKTLTVRPVATVQEARHRVLYCSPLMCGPACGLLWT